MDVNAIDIFGIRLPRSNFVLKRETLGISVSSAINMFYKQIILQQGIPFDVKLPKAPENSAKWSKERLDAELEKGYNDMLKGRTRPAAKVLSDVKKKYKV